MNKIDLIIDALESWQHSCLELGRCSSELGLATKALAAARELKALKPVAMIDHSHPFSDDSVYMIANYERSLPSGTKLYALDDEVKHD